MNGPIQLSADTALFSSELRTLLFGLTTVGIIIYLLGWNGTRKGIPFVGPLLLLYAVHRGTKQRVGLGR